MHNSILIVEDELKIINFIKRGLEEDGYTVDAANNTQLGYFLADTNKYDLIVLDVMTSKMEGLKLFKKLKEKKIPAPILSITSKDATSKITSELSTGGDQYITKPFEFEDFLLHVNNLLKKRLV